MPESRGMIDMDASLHRHGENRVDHDFPGL
jgi:hypothetical protein